MYVKQKAWLMTSAFKDCGITRAETIKRTRGSYVPAPLNGCEYLCRCLESMGFFVQRGDGRDPLDMVHVDVWDRRLELELMPVEIQMIIRLSLLFVNSVVQYSGNPMAVDPNEPI